MVLVAVLVTDIVKLQDGFCEFGLFHNLLFLGKQNIQHLGAPHQANGDDDAQSVNG